MISNDIKLLIEEFDEQPGFISRNKGKLALGALGLAGVAHYATNPEFANDINSAGNAIIKPGVKALRHAGLMKDNWYSNVATDAKDKILAIPGENKKISDTADAIKTMNKFSKNLRETFKKSE